MTTEQICKQLKRLSIERRPEACLGCELHPTCKSSVHGCEVMIKAIALITVQEEQIERGEAQHPALRRNRGAAAMRKRLQNARHAVGLTQQEMADRLGVGLRHYKKIESGETLGSVSIWDAIEDIVAVNQRDLREIYHGKEDSP